MTLCYNCILSWALVGWLEKRLMLIRCERKHCYFAETVRLISSSEQGPGRREYCVYGPRKNTSSLYGLFFF
jgi:hypothetical protein